MRPFPSADRPGSTQRHWPLRPSRFGGLRWPPPSPARPVCFGAVPRFIAFCFRPLARSVSCLEIPASLRPVSPGRSPVVAAVRRAKSGHSRCVQAGDGHDSPRPSTRQGCATIAALPVSWGRPRPATTWCIPGPARGKGDTTRQGPQTCDAGLRGAGRHQCGPTTHSWRPPVPPLPQRPQDPQPSHGSRQGRPPNGRGTPLRPGNARTSSPAPEP